MKILSFLKGHTFKTQDGKIRGGRIVSRRTQNKLTFQEKKQF